jgi:hypothetical protein
MSITPPTSPNEKATGVPSSSLSVSAMSLKPFVSDALPSFIKDSFTVRPSCSLHLNAIESLRLRKKPLIATVVKSRGKICKNILWLNGFRTKHGTFYM